MFLVKIEFQFLNCLELSNEVFVFLISILDMKSYMSFLLFFFCFIHATPRSLGIYSRVYLLISR